MGNLLKCSKGGGMDKTRKPPPHQLVGCDTCPYKYCVEHPKKAPRDQCTWNFYEDGGITPVQYEVYPNVPGGDCPPRHQPLVIKN